MLPITEVVFNTEAHPLPRFQLGKLFKTNWQRKPRDAEGNFIEAAAIGSIEAPPNKEATTSSSDSPTDSKVTKAGNADSMGVMSVSVEPLLAQATGSAVQATSSVSTTIQT